MNKKKKKKKKIIWTIFKIILIIIISMGTLGTVASAAVILAMVKSSPGLNLNSLLTLNEPSVLYDDNGKFMDEAPTLENREVIALKDMPQNLINAFVATEDERFFKHHGVDTKRLAGVILSDAKQIITGRGGIQGASTLTQQLIRNTILSNEVTLKRKVQEMYLSTELEKTLSKEQILEAYLNTINLGGNVQGVQKAAKLYFNKDVKQLSLLQCAYIAGVTQNPSRFYAFSPARLKDPTPYIDRTKTVLGQMLKNNYIDEKTYNNAVSDLDNKKLIFEKPKSAAQANKLNYEWFSRPVMNAVKDDLKKQYLYSDKEVENLLMYDGLKIYTTMDRQLQDNAQDIMNNDSSLARITVSPFGVKAEQPQGAAVVMDYHTGQVKALIGGRGNQPANSYNRAASKKFIRATGSAIKPLTVYSPAIDTKKATAATVIEDSPLPAAIGKQWHSQDGSPYNPRNDNGIFTGYETLRSALKSSINVVAVKLENQIGLSTGLSYAEKFGIKFTGGDRDSIAALSLGQFAGTTPLAMASAYGTFGNNGIRTDPILYTKVVDNSGNVILETKPVTTEVLSPQSAYIMYDLLKGPPSPGGTGPSARFGSMPVAGKTGTATDKEDLWFCGLTPYYSGAVWLGTDTQDPISLNSNNAAALWGKIMAVANKDLPVKDIDMPPGLVRAAACRDSGKIPNDLCARDPRGNRAYQELFNAGTAPKASCDIHVEADVNKNNGKLATEFTAKDLIERRVFIKRDYKPTVNLSDQQYVLPTETDDTKS